MRKRVWIPLVLVGLLSLSVFGGALAADTTVVVTTNDVGNSWFTGDTRTGGSVDFVAGPSNPPLGSGSLELATTDDLGSSQAKAQLFNYDHIGTPLADIDAISYAEYRDGSSTNSAVQVISLNIEVDFNGDAPGGFTTLVWEPVYNTSQGAIVNDTWQLWDAYNGGTAVWWSSRPITGVCAFDCFVTWDHILQNNPDARILGGFGFNIGSGWSGEFQGNADALTLGVSGDSVTYDFEPLISPADKDECKNDGWQTFNAPSFENQGQCIQFVNTGK